MSTIDKTEKTHSAVVGNTSEYSTGDKKLRSVGERRIVVMRTPSGIHALDNTCPHQGYGLTTGSLDGELITCQWHNWKFDARSGECVVGEENVACHEVSIDAAGDITVSVTELSDEQTRTQLWPSLSRAIESAYVGQISREAIRLLEAGAAPEDIMWKALEPGLAKNEYGPGHAMAMATDCLTIACSRDGSDRALPLVQGIVALAEETRGRPSRMVPPPDSSVDLAEAIEDEDIDGAMAAVLALIENGATPTALRALFIDIVSQHHLGYGHGIIYTQKAFELLEMVGWDRANVVLPHLAAAIAYQTREDLLPYMKKPMVLIEAADLELLATTSPDATWGGGEQLVDHLLDADTAPIPTGLSAIESGAGVEGLLDTISIASARRLLRHDLGVEFSPDDPFGWLDITHALTMNRAVRWAWSAHPGPATARLALFSIWLLHDSGRAERRHGVGPEVQAGAPANVLHEAIRKKDVEGTLGFVLDNDSATAGAELIDAALADPSGAFIVMAHLVKLSQAAREEAEVTGSNLPLLAAARYLSSPRRERFVGRNVDEALSFVTTGNPPRR